MGFGRKQERVIHCGRQALRYEIVRRERVRRNVYLDLSEDGGLQVIAPLRVSERWIRNELQARSAQVLEFVVRAREKRESLPVYGYEEGEKHPFLGRHYPIVLLKSGRLEPFDGERIVLRAGAPGREAVLPALRRWYREQAQAYFPERLAEVCERAHWVEGELPSLSLRRMKRTMGNCSRSGHIKLNPHLVKAAPELVDYVIAHEVCHLAEHNHGPGFYLLLDGLYPEWESARARLRRNWPIYLAE